MAGCQYRRILDDGALYQYGETKEVRENMKHLVNLHDVELAVVHDIKKRNCRKHTGGCRGCALFVDRESGLDCAAMMMEQSLEEERKS